VGVHQDSHFCSLSVSKRVILESSLLYEGKSTVNQR
jgi:hypothetical protein